MKRLYKILLVLFMVPSAIQAITMQQAKKLEKQFLQVGIYNPKKPNDYNETVAKRILDILSNSPTFKSRASSLSNAQQKSLLLRIPSTAAAQAPTTTQTRGIATLDQNKLQQLNQANAQLQSQLQAEREQAIKLKQQAQAINQQNQQLYNKITQQDQQSDYIKQQLTQTQQQNAQLQQQVAQLQPLAQSAKNLVPALRKQNQKKDALISSAQQQNTQLQQQVTQLRSQSKQKEEALLLQLQAKSQASQNLSTQLEQTQKQLQNQALQQQQELNAQQLKNTQLQQQHQAQLQNALNKQKLEIQQDFKNRFKNYQTTQESKHQEQMSQLNQQNLQLQPLAKQAQALQLQLKKITAQQQQTESNNQQLQQQLQLAKQQQKEQQTQLEQQQGVSTNTIQNLKQELQQLRTAQNSWNSAQVKLNKEKEQLQQQLNKNNEQLQNQKTQYEEQLNAEKEKQQQLLKTQQELKNLRTAQTSWNKTQNELNQEKIQLQQQLESLKSKQQETESSNQKLQEQLKEKQQQEQELQQLRSEQTSWNKAQEENERLQQQLQLAQQQLNEQKKQLNQQNIQLKERLEQEKQTQLNQQKENFESQINKLKKEKNDLEQSLEAKLKIPQQEIQNLTLEVLGLENKIKEKVQEKENAINKVKQEGANALDKLKAEHLNAQKELQKQLKQQKDENDRIRAELANQTKQNETNKQQLEESATESQTIKQLQSQLEQKQQQHLKALNAQKEASDKVLKATGNTLINLKNENKQLTEQLNKQKPLQQTSSNEDAHIKELNLRLQTIERENHHLKSQLEPLHQKYQDCNKVQISQQQLINEQQSTISKFKKRHTEDKTSGKTGKKKSSTETSTLVSRQADAKNIAHQLFTKKTLKTAKKWQDVGIYFFNKTDNTLDVWKDQDKTNLLAISPKLHVTQLDKLPFKAGEIKNALYYKSHGDLIGLLASEYTIKRNEIEIKAKEAFQVTGNILITITPTALGYAKKIEIFNPTTIKLIKVDPELAKNFPRIAKALEEFSWRNWTFEDFLTQRPHFVLDVDKSAKADTIKSKATQLKKAFKANEEIINAIDAAAYYMTKKPPKFAREIGQLELAKNIDIGPINVRFGQKTYQLATPMNPRIAIEQAKIQKALPGTPGAGKVAKEQQELIVKIKGVQQKETNDWLLIQEKQEKAISPLMSKNYTKEQVRILTEWAKGGINPEGWCGEQYEKNGTILLYTIHGTWSNKAAFGGDITTLSTYYIFKFACQLAHSKKKRVKIVSVSWSGKLAPKDRTEKASQLAKHCLQQWKENNIQETWMIGHSHGCNVAAMTANNIFDQTKKLVDVGIFLACPTLQVPRPLDFNVLYAFYAQGDFTQVAGSAELGYNFNRKMPLAQPSSGQKVYNIRTMLDGYDLDHVSIKWAVMPYLAKTLTTINTDYPHNFDLEMNVKSDLKTWPRIAIRNKGPQYRSQIDAQAWIKDKLARDAFQQEYKRDMSRMGNFYLSGVTWLLNLAREGWSAFQGEPTLGLNYLEQVQDSSSSSSSSQHSSTSSDNK